MNPFRSGFVSKAWMPWAFACWSMVSSSPLWILFSRSGTVAPTVAWI